MEMINLSDMIIGTVIATNSRGCYVLDDETGTVVYYYGNGKTGDRVLVSLRKIDTERNRITYRLDSVIEYAA